MALAKISVLDEERATHLLVFQSVMETEVAVASLAAKLHCRNICRLTAKTTVALNAMGELFKTFPPRLGS
jgi:hypothetical protein